MLTNMDQEGAVGKSSFGRPTVPLTKYLLGPGDDPDCRGGGLLGRTTADGIFAYDGSGPGLYFIEAGIPLS